MRILTHEFLWELTLIARNYLDTDECYITGGAVRDMILGKPHRDIDIFVKSSVETRGDIEKCIRAFAAAHGQVAVFSGGGDDDKYTGSFINASMKWKDENINIIGVWEHPLVDMASHDFAFCQAAVLKNTTLMSSEFVKSVAAKRIVYCGVGGTDFGARERHEMSSAARLKRMISKYPDWELDESLDALYSFIPGGKAHILKFKEEQQNGTGK